MVLFEIPNSQMMLKNSQPLEKVSSLEIKKNVFSGFSEFQFSSYHQVCLLFVQSPCIKCIHVPCTCDNIRNKIMNQYKNTRLYTYSSCRCLLSSVSCATENGSFKSMYTCLGIWSLPQIELPWKKKKKKKTFSFSFWFQFMFKMKLKYFLGRGNYNFCNFVGGKKVSHKNQNLFRSPNHPLGIKLPWKWWHLHTTSDCRAP